MPHVNTVESRIIKSKQTFKIKLICIGMHPDEHRYKSVLFHWWVKLLLSKIELYIQKNLFHLKVLKVN